MKKVNGIRKFLHLQNEPLSGKFHPILCQNCLSNLARLIPASNSLNIAKLHYHSEITATEPHFPITFSYRRSLGKFLTGFVSSGAW